MNSAVVGWLQKEETEQIRTCIFINIKNTSPIGQRCVLSYWNIYAYLDYDSFPDDFGRFWRFFLSGNGRTDEHTDGRIYGRTDPFIEMRGRI